MKGAERTVSSNLQGTYVEYILTLESKEAVLQPVH